MFEILEVNAQPAVDSVASKAPGSLSDHGSQKSNLCRAT
jgi:hypothetical protein